MVQFVGLGNSLDAGESGFLGDYRGESEGIQRKGETSALTEMSLLKQINTRAVKEQNSVTRTWVTRKPSLAWEVPGTMGLELPRSKGRRMCKEPDRRRWSVWVLCAG